jgi:hypothetical protein
MASIAKLSALKSRLQQILSRLIWVTLVPPILIAVTVLVILGLIDFDLLVIITARVISVIVIVGIPLLILKRLLFPK